MSGALIRRRKKKKLFRYTVFRGFATISVNKKRIPLFLVVITSLDFITVISLVTR